MKKIISLAAFLWLLTGCKTGPADSLTSLFPKTETPAPAPLCIGLDAIQEPVLLLSADSVLICTNHRTPKAIRVYNLNDGRWNDLVSLGRAGTELLNVASIWLSGNALHVYDANSGKILRIPSDELFLPNPSITAVPFQRGYFGLAACARADRYAGMAVLGGEPSDAPFSLLGGDGGKISGFGAYRDSDSGTDRNELRFAYQGVLNMNGDGTRIAYASFFRFRLSVLRQFRSPEYPPCPGVPLRRTLLSAGVRSGAAELFRPLGKRLPERSACNSFR